MPTNNPVTRTIDALAKGTVPEDDALLALLACDSPEKSLPDSQFLLGAADIPCGFQRKGPAGAVFDNVLCLRSASP